MYAASTFALCQPDVFPGAVLAALTFTAVIIIPVGFLFGLLREKMAAKISTTTTTAPRTRLVVVRPVRPASRHCHNPESVGA
jgi:hypothetical protein